MDKKPKNVSQQTYTTPFTPECDVDINVSYFLFYFTYQKISPSIQRYVRKLNKTESFELNLVWTSQGCDFPWKISLLQLFHLTIHRKSWYYLPAPVYLANMEVTTTYLRINVKEYDVVFWFFFRLNSLRLSLCCVIGTNQLRLKNKDYFS